MLASNLKFGNQTSPVQLWGLGEEKEPVASKPAAVTSSKEKMQRALALTQKKPSMPDSSSSDTDQSSDASAEEEQEMEQIDPKLLSTKMIVGNRVVELDGKEKCTLWN